MKEPPENRLRETAWRRPLTAAEQDDLRAWLAAHPDAQADWEAERGLNAALRTLPDAPVPSNFTARVLEQIEREPAAERARTPTRLGLVLHNWLPRFAVGVVAAGAVLASAQLYATANRAKVGQSVALLSAVTPAPPLDSLGDFDSIRKLGPAQGADTELLALLQ
jgi:anti-sigma factor RsiW